MSGSADTPLTVTFTNKSNAPLTADILQAALQLPAIKQIAGGHQGTVRQDGDSFVVTYAKINVSETADIVLGERGQLSLTYANGDQSVIQAGSSPIAKEAARVIASIAAMNLPTARAEA